MSYDAFTADNRLNSVVLAALQALIQLVSSDELVGRLRVQEQRLREFVSAEVVTPADVRQIELSRLNDHYATLLELSRLVLEREFFEDVRAGSRRSLALFVNMNDVFERIVERAFRAAAAETGLRVEGQASIPDLVDGPHAVSMRPDVLVRDETGTPVLVADAKWKTGIDSASSGDVYQLTSYILSLDVPGMLVYPGANEVALTSDVGGHTLQSVGFPTDAAVDSYEAYVGRLEGAAQRYL